MAIFSTLGITFLLIGGDRKDILPFLDARDPYLSNGTNAVLSISLEKKSIFARFCMGILAWFFENAPRTEKNNFVDKVASEYP